MINLTIGIPTYNRAGSITKLLAALSDEATFGDVEILVSDNASLDSTVQSIESFRFIFGERLVIHRNHDNLGFDGNVHQIYTRARGRYIWFLSDDDGFMPGAVEKLLHVIRTQEDCGLIGLPGEGMEPYLPMGDSHAIALLPWKPSGKGAQVVLGRRQVLSGNEYERLALVVATSQISHCVVRRGVSVPTAEHGGMIFQSRLANLNLLHTPHYYIMPERIVVQGPWDGSSQWFMDSTLFGVRALYENPDMRFSGETIDFMTTQTCLFGLGLLQAHYEGNSPAPIHFPAIGQGLADKLSRIYGAAYARLEPAIEELLKAVNR